MFGWDQAARAALFAGMSPTKNGRTVPPYDLRDRNDPTKLPDNRECRFHMSMLAYARKMHNSLCELCPSSSERRMASPLSP